MNLSADRLPQSARIIAVADVFDAVSAKRPYREAMPLEKALAIIQADVPKSLCRDSFEALKVWSETDANSVRQSHRDHTPIP